MEPDEERLETFFAAARRAAPAASPALLARILADAEAARPRTVATAAPAPDAHGITGWLAALGGWGGLGGLATAMAAGLWVGYAGLDGTSTLTGGLIGGTDAAVTVELLPGAGALTLLAGWEG